MLLDIHSQFPTNSDYIQYYIHIIHNLVIAHVRNLFGLYYVNIYLIENHFIACLCDKEITPNVQHC